VTRLVNRHHRLVPMHRVYPRARALNGPTVVAQVHATEPAGYAIP